MAIFTVAAAVFFHKFWAVSGDEAMVEHIMFFKDLSIAGGLALLVAFGAGGWSMDDQLGPPNGAVDHKPTYEDQPTLDQGLYALMARRWQKMQTVRSETV